jgi:hypothetical protein
VPRSRLKNRASLRISPSPRLGGKRYNFAFISGGAL